MNTIEKSTGMDDVKVSVRMKLSALWVALMLLYIYADIFSLYRPGQIEKMMEGFIGPLAVTQASLFVFSITDDDSCGHGLPILGIEAQGQSLGQRHPGRSVHSCQYQQRDGGDLGLLSVLWCGRNRADAADCLVRVDVAQPRSIALTTRRMITVGSG